MAARRDDLHRPLLEEAPEEIPSSISDSTVHVTTNTEMADMASQKTQPNPNPNPDVDAVDEYEVITEADVGTRRTRRWSDVQRRHKTRDRVTWAGSWRSSTIARV